ncbi:MAG: Stp1/IreP family PP2C-type Ser/Thr phosphatase [Candidatus Methanofastidiosia archaeon]|jgi:protein phosphatase
MKVGYKSDIGKRRNLDEDSIAIVQSCTIYESKSAQATLLVVADGMGGHNAGERASFLATRRAAKEITEVMFEKHWDDLSPENIKNAIREAIQCANDDIFNRVQDDPQCQGMGTTVTLALILQPTGSTTYPVYIGHVGDSRAYIVGEEKIKQITKDHSLVQQLLDNNEISQEEAWNHPQKNIITRAVGVHEKVNVDTFEVYLFGDDFLLLCCDGVTDLLKDDEIHRTVVEIRDPQKICDTLVDEALSKGGSDNISVIVAQFYELEKKSKLKTEKTQKKSNITEKDEITVPMFDLDRNQSTQEESQTSNKV